jgi:hypothetical protein
VLVKCFMVGQRTILVLAGLLGSLGIGCGGVSRDNPQPREPGTGGQASAPATGGTGAAGGSVGGSTSAPTGGSAGAQTGGCRRGGECTVDLAIDDDIGSYCATKANGGYRCWQDGGAVANTLPEEHYRRVSLSRVGPVGLTSDGRIVVPAGAAQPFDPRDKIVDIQTTNMWGWTSVCTLDANGAAAVNSGIDPVERFPDGSLQEPREIPGRFMRSRCAWEGMTAGILADGSIVRREEPSLLGNDFTDLALSLSILCGLRRDGSVMCGPSYQTQHCILEGVEVVCEPLSTPGFEGTGWLDVAATFSVACAVYSDGELFCQRFDGAVLLRHAGPYVRVEAGKNIVCALRTDGTSACFQHASDDADFLAATALTPLPIDPGW